MSNAEPILWAFKHAPVVDSAERLVLMALADAADEDGCNAYLSQATIAERAMVDVRTVRRKLPELELRRLIGRGDQSAAEHIPADKRPVVYDVLVPYVRFMDIEQTNRYRANRGRKPLTEGNRPLQPPAPAKPTRRDKGTGRTPSPAGHEVRADTEPEPVGLEVPSRQDSVSYNPPLVPSPTNPPPQSSRPDSVGTKPKRDPNEGRVDVDRLCEHLHQRLTELDVKHDHTSKAWRDAARLTLDADGRDLDHMIAVIDWALGHHFWHQQIHSMPTLRKQYDRLRLGAKAEREGKASNVRQIPNRITGTDEDKARITAAWGRTNG